MDVMFLQGCKLWLLGERLDLVFGDGEVDGFLELLAVAQLNVRIGCAVTDAHVGSATVGGEVHAAVEQIEHAIGCDRTSPIGRDEGRVSDLDHGDGGIAAGLAHRDGLALADTQFGGGSAASGYPCLTDSDWNGLAWWGLGWLNLQGCKTGGFWIDWFHVIGLFSTVRR